MFYFFAQLRLVILSVKARFPKNEQESALHCNGVFMLWQAVIDGWGLSLASHEVPGGHFLDAFQKNILNILNYATLLLSGAIY